MAPSTRAIVPPLPPAAAPRKPVKGLMAASVEQRAPKVYRTPDGQPATGPFVSARLEEAMATLSAMRITRCTPAGISSAWPDILHDEDDLRDQRDDPDLLKVDHPSPDAITRMDQTLRWVNLIRADPQHPNQGGCLLRKLALLRAQISLKSGREVWSWRRLEERFGRSRETLRRDHETAIFVITIALNEGGER